MKPGSGWRRWWPHLMLGAVALLALGAWVYRVPVRSAPAPGPATPPDPVGAADGAPAQLRLNTAVAAEPTEPVDDQVELPDHAATTALPPGHAALVDYFEELAARAHAGDGSAALRLYADTQDCTNAPNGPVARVPLDLRDVQTATKPRELQQQVQTCLIGLRCAGTTEVQLRDPAQWLLRAAEAGDGDARALLAIGLPLLFNGLDGMAHMPRLRRDGLRWLRESAANGHRMAMAALGWLYLEPDASMGELLAEQVPQDHVLGMAYLLAAHRLDAAQAQQSNDPMIRTGRQRLGPAEWAAAQALALELQVSSSDMRSMQGIEADFAARVSTLRALLDAGDPRCIDPAALRALQRRLAESAERVVR